MTLHSIDIKRKAQSLRVRGFSIAEIAKKTQISKSTASLWCRSIILDQTVQNRILARRDLGKANSRIFFEKRKKQLNSLYEKNAIEVFSKVIPNNELYKVLASALFATEGGKYTNTLVTFINSDPKTIALFLELLRLSFDVDEKKFRALIHIHEYHIEEDIKKFWSRITKIPLGQFHKSYLKPNTGKNKREGYRGTISIRYLDYRVALELRWVYTILTNNIGGVV